MGLRADASSGRTLRERTDHFIGLLKGYDGFSLFRERLARDVDWMLAISLGSLLWAFAWLCTGAISPGSANLSLFLLVIAFFSLSAMLFAIYRATLFIVQVLLEGAVGSVDRVQDRSFLRRQRSVRGLYHDAYAALDGAVALWWKAHRIAVASALIVIPAFCFYVLGLAFLAGCVACQVMLP